MKTKQCTKCKKIKTLDNFRKREYIKKNGEKTIFYRGKCCSCIQEYNEKHKSKNIEHYIEREKQYYNLHKEQKAKKHKKWKKEKLKEDSEYFKKKEYDRYQKSVITISGIAYNRDTCDKEIKPLIEALLVNRKLQQKLKQI